MLAGAARAGLARKWHCHRAMASRVLGEIVLGKRNSKCEGPEACGVCEERGAREGVRGCQVVPGEARRNWGFFPRCVGSQPLEG